MPYCSVQIQALPRWHMSTKRMKPIINLVALLPMGNKQAETEPIIIKMGQSRWQKNNLYLQTQPNSLEVKKAVCSPLSSRDELLTISSNKARMDQTSLLTQSNNNNRSRRPIDKWLRKRSLRWSNRSQVYRRLTITRIMCWVLERVIFF